MKHIKYIQLLLFILLLGKVNAQEWTIAFSPVDVDCVTNTACYNVLMKSLDRDFELGSSNLRLFYNAGTQKYLRSSGSVKVNKSYRITNENIINQTGSFPDKGTIAFDEQMGLLDIPIDFEGKEEDALLITNKQFEVVATNICFSSTSKEAVANSADFVWVSEKTKENYTRAETTINGVSGETTNLSASSFETLEVETRSDCGTSNLLVSATNYPNPFSESTKLTYQIQFDTDVKLSVFSMDGRLVLEQQTYKLAGVHAFDISKDDLEGAGVYAYKIQTSNNSIESRMILLK